MKSQKNVAKDIKTDQFSFFPVSKVGNSQEDIRVKIEEFKKLFDNLPISIILLDQDGCIIDTNDYFIEISQYDRSDLAGKSFEILLDEDDILLFQKNLADIKEEGSIIDAHYLIHCKNNEKFTSEIDSKAVYNDDKSINFIVCTLKKTTRQSFQEKRLTTERQYLESLLKNMPVPLVLIHTRYAITFCNKAFRELIGYELEEINTFEKWSEKFYPDPEYREFVGKQWQNDLVEFEKKRLLIREFYVMTKSGEQKVIRFNTVKFNDTEFMIIMIDLTRERKVEQDLKEGESRYKALSEATFEAVFINLGRECIACNDQAVKMFGYKSQEELLQYSVFDGIAPESMETVREHFMSKSEEPYEIIAQRKDGSRFAALASAKSAIYNNQEVRISIVRDIDKEKQAIRELEQREIELLEAQRITHLGNWIIDLKTGNDFWSDEMFRIFDLDPLEYTSFAAEEVARFIDEDSRDHFLQTAQDLAEGKSSAEDFYFITTQKGERKYVFVKGHQELDEDGKPSRIIGVMHDVTKLKQIEDEKKELESRIKEAQKRESLSILAGGIAHDFNNLLAGILGNANLAITELSRLSPAYDYLQEIENAAKKASELTRKMLAYSGQGKFIVTTFDLNELISEMIPGFESSLGSNIKISFNHPDKNSFTKGDINLFRQLLTNLIKNAEDALEEKDSGQIQISCENRNCRKNELINSFVNTSPEDGDYVVITISDNGTGIENEILNKIFDPFFSTRFTGRGLGLAAVAGIVEGHKGYIQVNSEIGKGSTFKIYLPQEKEVMQGIKKKEDSDKVQSDKKVLIIEDENYIRSLGQRALTYFGLDATGISNFMEAQALLKRNPDEFQIIILDTTLPEIDFKEAYKEIRKISSQIIVLIASDYLRPDDYSEFENTHNTGFIQKPYKPQYLIDNVKKYL